MKGYSKITSSSSGASQKSRSIDFSDLFSFPQTPKTKRNPPTAPKLAADQDDEAEAEDGERFGVILGRSGSVSSAGFQATMKRAFSMRRSSSVSDKYCRIHDKFMVIPPSSSPITDHDHDNNTIPSAGGRGGGGGGGKKKILRACKRLLGL